MKPETKEIFYAMSVFLGILMAYFILWSFISYATSKPKKQAPPPTYGRIISNSVA
jgi:hypothetical protein